MLIKHFAYRLRAYPTKTQIDQIRTNIGAARWVYNEALATKRFYWEEWGENIRANSIITMLPYWKSLNPWLKEADSVALQQAIRILEENYQQFFKIKGRGKPDFKSKHKSKWSYRTMNTNKKGIRITGKNRIRLPKLGDVKCKISREVKGTIKSATVTEERDGSFYVSLSCEDVFVEDKPEIDKCVGIDLGLKKLVVTSDNETFDCPKTYRKAEKKLAREQRRLSRKQGPRYEENRKASKNYVKQRKKVAKLHKKIANQRKDYNNKLTTALINENQVICAETLAVKNMVKNHKLAKSLHDAAFSEILRMLAYKADWYERDFVQIDRWFPSTKTCSCCGHKQDMSLSERIYECPECGSILDRDYNASLNILREGLRILGWDTPEVNACGDGVRLRENEIKSSPHEAIVDEARIPLL